MRGTRFIRNAAVVAILGLFACSSSPSISDGTLSFLIAEGLLVVVEPDADSGVVSPQYGAVVLASNVGACPLLQQGYPYNLIPATGFLYFPLEQLLPDNDAGPLVAGTYNIIDLSSNNAVLPGLVANAFTIETDIVCTYTSALGTGGTVSVTPMNTDAGATSDVSFSVIFTDTRITGAYSLSTCVLKSDTPVPDGGCIIP